MVLIEVNEEHCHEVEYAVPRETDSCICKHTIRQTLEVLFNDLTEQKRKLTINVRGSVLPRTRSSRSDKRGDNVRHSGIHFHMPTPSICRLSLLIIPELLKV